jgi:hypothetical protein
MGQGENMSNPEEVNPQYPLLAPDSIWLKVILVVIFLIAALIRRDEIMAPGHLIEREYNSAIFARAFYYENNSAVESWERDIAVTTRNQLPVLEPPLTEYLVSLLYRIVGSEEIWYARYLTSFFWLVSGIFLYKTVRLIEPTDAATALLALGYYFFVPMGVIISRSFQPDSLMMLLFMVSLYCIILYFKRFSWRFLLLASIVTGVTLLFRPLVLFALFFAFLALSIYKRKPGSSFISKPFLVFYGLSIPFPVVFYGYGIYIAEFLRGQADLSFRPHLLTHWKFWQGWFNDSTQVIGPAIFVFAFLGFLLMRKGLSKTLVAGLAAGYFIFGLVFTFHIHSHPYYHIQIFPLIAISAAAFVVIVIKTFRQMAGRNWWIPILVSLLFVTYTNYREVRSTLYKAVFENPSLAQEIGDVVGHSAKTVFVAHHYGLPLEYYGKLAGAPWPVRIDDPFYRLPGAQERSVEERLETINFTPEYFVITDFQKFNLRHQDLKVYLERNCSIYAGTDQYLVFNACQSAASGQQNLMP